MIPVSLWPVTLARHRHPSTPSPPPILGLGYLWYTIRFARIVRAPRLRKPRATYARDLLRASVIYLPLLLAAMMLDAKGRLLF